MYLAHHELDIFVVVVVVIIISIIIVVCIISIISICYWLMFLGTSDSRHTFSSTH